jgi:peptide chain release factor 1
MLDKLASVKERYEHLEQLLSDPEVTSDMERFTKISKDYRGLEPLVKAYDAYAKVLSDIQGSREILSTERDPELLDMAKEELALAEPEKTRLEEEIRILLIPKDPEDEKNAVLEIRSGTGGDEASIFAGDLMRMYERYLATKGWRVELQESAPGTAGGYNRVIVEVYGDHVYGTLKYESGVHRVQRVPKTESQGRVHTSAATVAVMPILEMEDVQINRADLRIDVFRASGAGGQHVNRTESAVRITHLPTGVVAESQEARSQIKNREIAEQRLFAKIFDMRQEEHDRSISERRKTLVSTGDRSAKIRTYNYPQNRVTDHRIELTSYNLTAFMDGDIQAFIDALQMAENTEKLKAADELV